MLCYVLYVKTNAEYSKKIDTCARVTALLLLIFCCDSPFTPDGIIWAEINEIFRYLHTHSNRQNQGKTFYRY